MSQEIQIVYASEKYIPSFHALLDQVARERIYIEMIEAPPIESTTAFQKGLIERNAPVFYAIKNDQVVGWIDISPSKNPRMAHRGGLGMGLSKDIRGKGIGTKLMTAALDHAKRIGLEMIELSVYTTNTSAIALYKKLGFVEEGVQRKFRKLDGQYFDALMMAKELAATECVFGISE